MTIKKKKKLVCDFIRCIKKSHLLINLSSQIVRVFFTFINLIFVLWSILFFCPKKKKEITTLWLHFYLHSNFFSIILCKIFFFYFIRVCMLQEQRFRTKIFIQGLLHDFEKKGGCEYINDERERERERWNIIRSIEESTRLAAALRWYASEWRIYTYIYSLSHDGA